MKIFLIALVLIFSLASCTISEVKSKRGVADEDMALEIQYYGSCREFKQEVLRSVWVNKFSNCLPIRVGVAQNPDNDDLHSHYFCTNYDKRRSIIHFPEIFETMENVPHRDFVLSLIPTAPFRVLTRGVSITRRPNCFTTQDYCNGTNYIVNGCKSNEVEYRLEDRDDKHDDHRDGYDRHGKRNVNELKNNGHGPQYDRRRRRFVVNKDRVYITSNQLKSEDCKTSVSECCPYVSHESFGGICPRTASQELNNFPRRPSYDNHHDDHHDDHHDNHYDDDHRDGRPGRPGFNRPGDDDHRDGRPGSNRPGYDNDDRKDGRPGRPGFNRPGDDDHRDGRPGSNRPGYDNDDRKDGRPGFNGHHDDDEDDDKKRSEETK